MRTMATLWGRDGFICPMRRIKRNGAFCPTVGRICGNSHSPSGKCEFKSGLRPLLDFRAVEC